MSEKRQVEFSGTANLIRSILEDTDMKGFTSHWIEKQKPFKDTPRKVISNTLNYLVSKGELSCEGPNGNRLYHIADMRITPKKDEEGVSDDPVKLLDDLLSVMAEAEPVLRRCQKILNAMK